MPLFVSVKEPEKREGNARNGAENAQELAERVVQGWGGLLKQDGVDAQEKQGDAQQEEFE